MEPATRFSLELTLPMSAPLIGGVFVGLFLFSVQFILRIPAEGRGCLLRNALKVDQGKQSLSNWRRGFRVVNCRLRIH